MNLEEIKAREQAATPGPWYEEGWALPTEDGNYVELTDDSPADAAFIAHARTDIPELIAEAERLTAENSELKFERDDYIKIGEDYRNKLLEAESDRDTLKKALELACEEISDYALPSGTGRMKSVLITARIEKFMNHAKQVQEQEAEK